jgi:CheY-like chemotaxis protein
MSESVPSTNYESIPNTSWQPCHILLVEDDPDDRAFAERELMASACVKDVTSFSSSDDLIGYMQDAGFMDRSVMALTPILILVDLEMPRRDGLAIIADLKTDQFLRDIPVIVVSGSMNTKKLEQARQLGANGVFPKPLRREILTDYLRNAWKWPPDDLWTQ